MAGRPSLYTSELADQILERMADGGSVKGACRALGVVPATFFRWVVDDVGGLAERYTRAQRLQLMSLRDETLEIADDATGDWVQGDNGPRLNVEHVRRSELRIKQRNHLIDSIAANLAAKESDRSGTMAKAEAIAALNRIAKAKAEPAQVASKVLPGFEES